MNVVAGLLAAASLSAAAELLAALVQVVAFLLLDITVSHLPELLQAWDKVPVVGGHAAAEASTASQGCCGKIESALAV